jgi:hypothetical protein
LAAALALAPVRISAVRVRVSSSPGFPRSTRALHFALPRMTTGWERRGLWGGALSCEAPRGLLDASSVREVADNAEVWLQASGDGSVLAEVCEWLDGDGGDVGAAAAHWRELARANDADGAHDAWLDARGAAAVPLPALAAPGAAGAAGAVALAVSGVQRVAKFREAPRNAVAVHVLLLRLPAVRADVVFCVNAPLAVDAASSSFREGELGCDGGAAVPADAGAAAAAAPPAARLFARGGATVDDVVARLAASITVHDWRLFDGDGGEAER